jgi:diphthamide synthase (EF-2-diphthine--ammonia ligase)
MKVAALFSGGKDSTFAMHRAMLLGRDVVVLVSIKSGNPHSYLFHTPNIDLVELQAKALAAATKNLPQQSDANQVEFDKRVKIAELMLKEADIKNKSKIVELQMQDKNSKMEQDFLNRITTELQ